MNPASSNGSELEGRLRELRATGAWPDAKFRQFACRCCRRVTVVFDHPVLQRTLAFAERLAIDPAITDRVELVRQESVALYDDMYSGDGAPSAEVLALAAVGEAAFTADPLKCATNAAFFVARAIARAEGDSNLANVDAIFDLAYQRECATLIDLLIES